MPITGFDTHHVTVGEGQYPVVYHFPQGRIETQVAWGLAKRGYDGLAIWGDGKPLIKEENSMVLVYFPKKSVGPRVEPGYKPEYGDC